MDAEITPQLAVEIAAAGLSSTEALCHRYAALQRASTRAQSPEEAQALLALMLPIAYALEARGVNPHQATKYLFLNLDELRKLLARLQRRLERSERRLLAAPAAKRARTHRDMDADSVKTVADLIRGAEALRSPTA